MRYRGSERLDSENGREDAVTHLHDALVADEPAEKNFHFRQAFQLLDADQALS